jgi:CRISPR-associated protein Csc3
MKDVEARSRQFIKEHRLTPSRESKIAPVFQEYSTHIIEVDGQLVGKSKESMYEQFAYELRRYVQSKEERKIICSLCASPYEADEQEASIILFKPQQYSNKAPLDTTQLKRGICPICSLEMMLRMVQQGLPGKNTQEKKAINLYLYPTYFFTTETAQVVRLFVNRLQNLNLYRLIYSHLEKQGFSYRNLINYQDFIIDDDTPQVIMKGRRNQPYSDEDQAALFFITLYPPGQKPTDTDAWILPAFYALALPLLLGVKCVATPSFAALYSSASDFQETARIDGGHQFIRYVLLNEYFRVDEIPADVERLLRVYSLHLDVYSDDRDAHWGQLTSVAKDLATDPLYVFQYYDRHQRQAGEDKKKRKGGKPPAAPQKHQGISPLDQQRYMGVYFALGGSQNMDFIGRLVDAYAQFYRPQWDKLDSAYAILRPLGTALKVAVESDPDTGSEDLLLLVSGALNDDQERVRADQADGYDPIVFNKAMGDYETRLRLSRQKIEDFARLFLKECFGGYCDDDRSLLRERANRIRSAARFYYLTHYGRNSQQKA